MSVETFPVTDQDTLIAFSHLSARTSKGVGGLISDSLAGRVPANEAATAFTDAKEESTRQSRSLSTSKKTTALIRS
jgi:hypothetical protein